MHLRFVLKDILELALELHLFMPLSIHNRAQNDSIKGELEGDFYVELEGTPKISL